MDRGNCLLCDGKIKTKAQRCKIGENQNPTYLSSIKQSHVGSKIDSLLPSGLQLRPQTFSFNEIYSKFSNYFFEKIISTDKIPAFLQAFKVVIPVSHDRA